MDSKHSFIYMEAVCSEIMEENRVSQENHILWQANRQTLSLLDLPKWMNIDIERYSKALGL